MNSKLGRTLAIGDIHGCLRALKYLEKIVKFNANDTIITLGDYIDRGPDSKGVLDWLIAARKKYNMITLLGNHEEMMQKSKQDNEAYYFWTMNGGHSTLDSFKCSINDIPDIYWEFIKSCKLYHETSGHIFIHAGLKPMIPIEKQKSDVICWLRFKYLEPHMSNKTMICGHTPQEANLPGVRPHAICIDTYAFNHNGYLTCLDVNTGEYWQTNNKQETRKNRIKPIGRKA